MFRTEICEILNIQYPVILGGMVWVGKAELTAAVSEAGGLGLLGAGGMSIEEIQFELATVKKKTSRPFGVNVPLARPDAKEMIDVSIKKGATVIATSSGSPKRHTAMIKERGCRVMHVVSSVTFARKCEEAGVDIVIAEGFEAGGHNGFDELTTMALIPQVVEAVNIPVVSAGGISDGKGLVAVLALGAKGVQMGTRFAATVESAAHPNAKNAIINCGDNDTCITGRTSIGPTRSIKNRLTAQIIKAENEGMPPSDLMEMIGGGRSVMACVDGDCDEGTVYCGQIGGLVNKLISVKEVIDTMMTEAKTIAGTLSTIASSSK